MFVGRKNVRVRKLDVKGKFSVKSFYNALARVDGWIVG